jgi:hypothetical protein
MLIDQSLPEKLDQACLKRRDLYSLCNQAGGALRHKSDRILYLAALQNGNTNNQRGQGFVKQSVIKAGQTAAAMLCVLVTGSAHADSEGYAQSDGNEVLTLQVENDLLFGTDENYTNGIRLSYVHRPGNTPIGDTISGFLRRFSPMARNALKSDLYYSVALGQNMYTPQDIESFDLIEDDRPYAGWTYLEFGVTVEDKTGYEAIKLDLGMVGPASLASKTQRWWHSVIGSQRPNGWPHQLPNEPGINLYYTRGHRFDPIKLSDDLSFDFTPHWGVALGNVYTYGAGGLTLRLGTNLDRDMGAPPRIQPSLPGSDHFSGDGFDIYLFAGSEVRAIARNIFLDGTWKDHEHDVNKKELLAEIQVGVVAFVGPVRMALTNAFRTSEFAGSGNHRYSAFTLSTRF